MKLEFYGIFIAAAFIVTAIESYVNLKVNLMNCHFYQDDTLEWYYVDCYDFNYSCSQLNVENIIQVMTSVYNDDESSDDGSSYTRFLDVLFTTAVIYGGTIMLKTELGRV